MACLLMVAGGLLFLPAAFTNHIRVWAGPAFSPLQGVAQGWTLDLAEQLRYPHRIPASAERAASLQEQVEKLENALAQAAARLGEYEKRLRDLAQIREGLDELPCRVIPVRIVAPEVAGGRAGARLAEGSEHGVRRGSAVVARHLNQGAKAGLESGEPVLTAAGLIGIVDQVGPLMSTVRFLTDPRSKLMVQVVMRRGDKWRAGPQGLAEGTQDGAALRLNHIGRAGDVRVGDFVVTSPSPESPLPPYLIVGRIVRCELKPAALFYTIEVEPRVAPGKIREAYVLAPTARHAGVLGEP
ncbi:MAG TPA: rod shape-determining protein MreC [Phycisphaerae bacterium]|nr:rod shape-determining protein MreC [Phycisphaerae bacterium]